MGHTDGRLSALAVVRARRLGSRLSRPIVTTWTAAGVLVVSVTEAALAAKNATSGLRCTGRAPARGAYYRASPLLKGAPRDL